MSASLNPYISKFDAGFDVGKSSQYRMTIQFSLGGFSYALLDATTFTLIGLECYQSDNLNEDDEIFRAIERALDAKGLNNSDFLSVTCLVDGRTNTLVPKDLFIEEEAPTYLDFTFQVPNSQVVLSETVAKENCINVFAVSKVLLNKIRAKWPTAQIRHSNSVFIEASMRYAPEGKAVFVNVRNRDFDVVIVDGGKLKFFNNFRFNTKDDFAYFLLFAIEQNGFSGTELPVCFSGLILPASEIVELCGRYIKYLLFVENRNELYVSKALDEVPYQYYYLQYQALR